MTRNQIFKAACVLMASDFLNLIEHNEVGFVIMDQDNVGDPNDGTFHIIVNGFGFTESLVFFNGELID